MPLDDEPFHLFLSNSGRKILDRVELEMFVDRGWPSDVINELQRLGRELVNASDYVKKFEGR